jgi:hypothetical protein
MAAVSHYAGAVPTIDRKEQTAHPYGRAGLARVQCERGRNYPALAQRCRLLTLASGLSVRLECFRCRFATPPLVTRHERRADPLVPNGPKK